MTQRGESRSRGGTRRDLGHDAVTLYSIGHGNRTGATFLRLLEASGIECVIDVRAYPASRHFPQFSRAALEAALTAAGLAYVWEGSALGGRRKPHADSPHTALAPDVRGFADHMASAAFLEAVARLMDRAARQPTAIMCAEMQPSQCHRSLLSDALVVRGAAVVHLIDGRPCASHVLSSAARVQGLSVVYDCGHQLSLL
jgi:uncharacterized protein (DUF488 family)